MSFSLTDDGTMDTVVRCDECGEEVRFNYDSSAYPEEDYSADVDAIMADDPSLTRAQAEDILNERRYDAFIDECCEEAAEDHECPNDPSGDDEPTEPSEEDITTDDYEHFYYAGKCIAEVHLKESWEKAIGAWCKKNNYFPDVWFISDHGNPVLISVEKNGRYLKGYAHSDE